MNKIIGIVLLAVVAMVSGQSCINEYTDSCKIRVGFQYTYNMLSADALPQQVDKLMLYVFDANDILRGMYAVDNSAKSPLSVETDRLEPGRYSFVAWGRSNAVQGDASAFEIPTLTVGQSHLDELKYRLRTNAGVSSSQLNNFFVGMQQADIKNTSNEPVMVDMKKVTNKVRVVVMPYTGGSTLGVDDYSFRIEDQIGNGLINHDFAVLEDAPVTYTPYFKSVVTPAAGENLTPIEIDRALAVEISTSRLLDSHAPRLKVVSNATGAEVVNINLSWLFSLTSMEEHRGWSLQEYLDRQDEYVITLFFRDDKWMDATIIINGWVVNNISIEGGE